MSGFDRDNSHSNYSFEEEELVEVEVDDNAPIDDDESIWTELNDDPSERIVDDDNESRFEEELAREPSIDMAVSTFRSHGPDSVYCVAIHPRRPGLVLTGGGDDKAYLWLYSTTSSTETIFDPTLLHELVGHTDSVTSVGFNFDGSLALTGAYDGTVRVWNVETGQLHIILEGPEDIEWAEWHSKGNAVIAGSKDGTVWMWLALNGQCLQVFAGHEGSVASGCFSRDGKFVCTGGEDGTIRLWAPKTGACKHIFEGHFGHEGAVTTLVGDSEGDLLLSGSIDGTVKLYKISNKKVLHTFVHCEPTAVVVQVAAAEESSKSKLDHDSSTKFLNGDIDGNSDDDSVSEDIEEAAILSVECVGFASGDLKWVASGGMDSYLKVWDPVNGGTCRVSCKHEGSVVALKWHSKLPLITTGALDFNIRVWDARNGALLAMLTGHNDLVTNLDMAPVVTGTMTLGDASPTAEDVIVSVSDDGTAKVFRINCADLILGDRSAR